MILKNNSSKIIGVLTTTFLPGKTEECPKGYEENPLIQQYIKEGVLSDETSSFSNEGDTNDAGNTSADPEFNSMTDEQLLQYAEEQNIDIVKATSREGILKKIQEAL